MLSIKPPTLRPGDTIGIVSPSSPQREEQRLWNGVEYLQSQGFEVKIGNNALKKYGGYLAGTDDERLCDLHDFFRNSDIAAIVCARGGYGSARLLRGLDYSLIRQNPKIFVGFSDATALQCALLSQTGLLTFSGAMASVDMNGGMDEFSERHFWKMFMSAEPAGNISGDSDHSVEPLYPGIAQGKLIGGNLSVLASLCGTPFMPDWGGALLLCEDVGEEPYRIDRLLSQLENCGIFEQISGFVFGQFTNSTLRPTSVPQRPVEEILAEYAHRTRKPAIMNVLYGHQQKKATLPIGGVARIDGEQGTLEIMEAAVV